MNFTFDNTGKKIINVSKDEVTQIDSIKIKLSKELNNFIENERDYLYFEVSQFITNEAIKSKLANLKYHIINDLDYNNSFKNIVHFKNGSVEFVQNDELYHFANAYQIINDTSNAQRVLRNILRVKLIDWLIENDFNEDNSKDFIYKIPKDLTTLNSNSYNSDIFKTPYAEKLFYYIINNINKINSRKKIGAFYSWFSKYLNCTKFDFANFWNDLNLTFNININSHSSASFENKSTDEMNEDLNNLKSDFDIVNTSS